MFLGFYGHSTLTHPVGQILLRPCLRGGKLRSRAIVTFHALPFPVRVCADEPDLSASQSGPSCFTLSHARCSSPSHAQCLAPSWTLGAPGAFPFGEILGRLQLHMGEAEAEAEEAPRTALGSGPSTQAQRSGLKLLFICVCALP